MGRTMMRGLLLAAVVVGSAFPLLAASTADGSRNDQARTAMLASVISRLQGSKACLTVRQVVLTSTAPLQVTDLAAVLADLRGASQDPSANILNALAGRNVVAESRCPDFSHPRPLHHVSTGPLRLIKPERAQMVVNANMDSFPEIYICEATMHRERWRVRGCTLVLEG